MNLTREEIGETLAVLLATATRNRREFNDSSTSDDRRAHIKRQQPILVSVLTKLNDDLKLLTPPPPKGTTV